ncbi:MAG: AAA family ATPase [Bacteroidia bacterium]|nr:AAA family ATPase [Bacteroidia bacterium]
MEKPLLENLHIKNFKSINDLKIDGFKRINLFLGKPNVGKSNILEALGLLAPHYYQSSGIVDFNNLVRCDSLGSLFHFGNIKKEISIIANNNDFAYYGELKDYGVVFDGFYRNLDKYSEDLLLKFPNIKNTLPYEIPVNGIWLAIGDKLQIDSWGRGIFNIDLKEYFPSIKRYKFSNSETFSSGEKYKENFLMPPFGKNILSMNVNFPELRKETISLFNEYKIEVVFDQASNALRIQKRLNENEVFGMSFGMISDTLKRLIFHLAAIKSNKNSLLIFEEPEAHSFPPYMIKFAQEVINSETNQFAIATHSPYVITDFLEDAFSDTAIFVVYYENNQTKVKQLTDAEMHDALQHGVDILLNIENYIPQS